MLSLFRSKPGLGWDPNFKDARDHDFRVMGLSASAVLNEEISLSKWAPPIWNQGGANSCVGEVIVRLIAMLEAQAGFIGERCSSYAVWSDSRAQHTDGWLTNSGTYPRTAFKCASKLGVPRESDWPRTLRNRNRHLTAPARMKAHAGRGLRYASLFSIGDRLIDEMIATLKSRLAFGFGMKPDKAFTRMRGPSFLADHPKAKDFIGGGHYLTCDGARPGPEGPEFRIAGSWSDNYRDDGFIWVGHRFMASAHVKDIIVPYSTDRTRNADRSLIVA